MNICSLIRPAALNQVQKVFQTITALTVMAGKSLKTPSKMFWFSDQINEDEELTLIDFPQMVSVGHGNARELFHRDVECIIR